MSVLSGVILVVAFVLSVGCCRSQGAHAIESGSPGDDYFLTSDQLVDISSKAKSGDSGSLKRLILHYELAQPDAAKAAYWQRVAAERGDVAAMLNLSGYLATDNGGRGCQEAVLWIERAKTLTTDERLLRSADLRLNALKTGLNGVGPCVQWFGEQSGKIKGN